MKCTRGQGIVSLATRLVVRILTHGRAWGAEMEQHRSCRAAARTPLRHALLVTTALCGASAFALIPPDRALAQSFGGDGGKYHFGESRKGGGYEQNGGNGASGTTSGGGGGGPGAAGTLGGLPGNNDAGGGGAGGVNGATAAAMPVGSFNGGNGGNATPAVNATTVAGGGGGAGGYGVALTTAGRIRRLPDRFSPAAMAGRQTD